MTTDPVKAQEADRSLTRTWMAMAAGALAAGLHLPVSYALVKWSCATNQRTVLVLLAVVAFLVAAAGAWLAWSCESQLRANADETGQAPADRSLFLARAALGIDVILALFIAASSYAPLVLSPCA
jgi:cytochrome bd-type quinol oxidase subunit 2